MNFVSLADLTRDVFAWVDSRPEWRGLAGVVGIPRSGVLPATMIALRLNLPLADLEFFLENGGRFYPARHGRSDCYVRMDDSKETVLVVDDSVSAGTTMTWARGELSRTRWSWRYEFGAVYGPSIKSPIEAWFDLYRRVSNPRMFEWNWTRSHYLDDAMLDLDGLICEDPDPLIARSPERYERWLPTARPLHLPLRKVRAVVSARLERYREQTERWLAEHGVRYDDLYLIGGGMTEEDRTRDDLHWRHKAGHYGQSASPLFIESDLGQARLIHEATGKAVLVPPSPGRGYQLYEVQG